MASANGLLFRVAGSANARSAACTASPYRPASAYAAASVSHAPSVHGLYHPAGGSCGWGYRHAFRLILYWGTG